MCSRQENLLAASDLNETEDAAHEANSIDASQSRPLSKRARRIIWSHFTWSKNEDGDDVASCNLFCVVYRKQQGTNNLWKHYRKRHEPYAVTQTTLTNHGQIFQGQPIQGPMAEQITALLVSLIVHAGKSFSKVENE